YNNLILLRFSYIEKDDLLRFMIKEEVDLVLPLIEGGETGKITRNAFTEWVAGGQTYIRSRRLVCCHLHHLVGTSGCINVQVFGGFLRETCGSWRLAFIVGSTCKNIFESFIFVFVMHPYDVGDRCVVDGVALLVEEIDLLTTKFLKLDNEKVFYPNATLISKPISNYYRSPDMGDPLYTKREALYLVQNTQNWYPEFLLFVQAIENVNKLNLNLVVTHTMNFQNFGEKNLRRTDLVIALKRILEDLEIDYTLLPQNVHLTGHK
ncbi:unnamed protein product, partial [Brassica oleracea]